MTAPQDPRKTPLQDDEIALARVLRALPGAEPPARLDAAILAAATDAVAPTPRRRVRPIAWLPTWALGSAAAAVLAVGVGLQLRPPLATAPLPQSESAQKTTRLPDARLSVELHEPPAEPIPAPAPPPAQPEPAPQSSPRRAPPPPPPPPAPVVAEAPVAPVAEAFPMQQAEAAAPAAAEAEADAATLDTVQVTGSRLRSEGADQARRAHQEAYATRARERQQAEAARQREELGRLEDRREAREQAGLLADSVDSVAPAAKATQDNGTSAGAARPAPPPAATAPAMAAAPAPPAAPPADAQARDLAANDASPQAFSYASDLPAVARDAELDPADWLARIRLRLARGDRDGARESLRLYQRAHPRAPVPDDLAAALR